MLYSFSIPGVVFKDRVISMSKMSVHTLHLPERNPSWDLTVSGTRGDIPLQWCLHQKTQR